MAIRPTSVKAAEYLWFGQKCLSLRSTGSKAIIDGLHLIICKYTPSDAVLIAISKKGFLTHARNGVPRGFQFPSANPNISNQYGFAHTGRGYTGTPPIDDGDETAVSTGNPFPLIDDDTKTWLFSKESDAWTAEGPQEIVYGNVDWKGPATEYPDDRKILTYRGNPSRYWPVNQFILIPGLSRVDHTIESLTGDYSYTTVFSEFIYEGGSIRATMPTLYAPMNSGIQRAQVLGAAYRESDGMLICIVKTCYLEIPPFDGHPGPGYFIEVLLEKAGDVAEGWTRMLRIPFATNMPNCNFFFSEDGTKACSVVFDRLYLITVAGDTASFTTESLGGFTNTTASTSTTVNESNPGIPDPAHAGGELSALYRTGVNSGDWQEKHDTTRQYRSTKSGTTILAADYKGNKLVKMQAKLTGSETYDHKRLFGFKWGYTALPPALHMSDYDRTPHSLRISADPYLDGNLILDQICVEFMGVCKPVVSITSATPIPGVTNCQTFSGPSTLNTSVCEGISSRELTVTAIVTDRAGGRSIQTSNTYTGSMIPSGGVWKAINSYTHSGSCSNVYGIYNLGYSDISGCQIVESTYIPPAGAKTYRAGAVVVTFYPSGSCTGYESASGMCTTGDDSAKYWDWYIDYEYWCSDTIRGW